MWLRNLLFIGLVGGGALAFMAKLMPPREKKLVESFQVNQADADLQASVARVDASFRKQWQEQSLAPVPPADDLLIARRLSLALVGTVPSLEEIRQFEKLPAAERLPWWLLHLMSDRRFGDYFAERFARAYVGTEEGPFILYRRRRLIAWLSEKLLHNYPYDQLVRDLITSEGLWTDKPATNFITVTRDEANANQPDPVRLAGRVTRAFLGLRIDCAQCHDHPFAEWKQSDFQSLSAYFGQTHLGLTGIYDGAGEYEVEERKTREKKVVPARVPFAADLVPKRGTRRQQLAEWVTHRRNPYFARAVVNRVWALLLGRPLAEPVDNLETDTAPAAALQILADDFAAHDFDLHRLIRVIAATQVFQLDGACNDEIGGDVDKAWAVFPMTRLRPEQVAASVIQSASVSTLDAASGFFTRLIGFFNRLEFVTSYGDSGEDEFTTRGGTIPQRLVLMNGKLQGEHIREGPFNADACIARMAPDDATAIDLAYLTILTRRATPIERDHFIVALQRGDLTRPQVLEDIYWTLLNSTEFSWNH